LSAKLNKALRVRQRVGKYRIEKRLGEGGFARVYQAMDTIQGIRVALKIPHAPFVTEDVLEDFRKEARTTSKLDHKNILPIKDASIIDERFVIVFPLGEETLDQRMKRRMSLETSLDAIDQILEAVAYAHKRKIIHCDIKPENVIMFPDGRVRLTDFGIAKVAQKTIRGSGTGTVGYMAPEQAMGKPSLKSDVFSVGLLMYRLLAGKWPEWPFEWPGPGYKRLRAQAHPELIAVIRKSLELSPRKRFRDGTQFLEAFRKTKLKSIRRVRQKRRRAA
jgi:serine/threonine-protein kinase